MNKNLFLLASSALVMLASCSGEKTQPNAGAIRIEADTVAVPVRVAKVVAQDVPQLVEFTANVEANKSNDIAPQSPVRITEIKAEVGDRVSQGQVLVIMDNTNLANAKTQLDNAKVEFARIDELYKVGGASKSQWDAQKTNLDVLQTSYNNMLENTTLRSPITGVVTARNYDAGDLYSGKAVLIVQQIQPVKLLINVNEQYFSLIREGMQIDNITFDAYPGETFSGRVSIVYPTLDAASRTFPVEIKITNADNRVRPGMFARVMINFGTKRHVVVPDQSVVKQTGSGDRYVYTVGSDNRVSYDLITLGRRIDNTYEILSGVEDGATVVVFGQNRLANGKLITVVE